ncbi:MAG: hypothetical protein KGL35_31470 [Bradyrhizobium sp.]|nr:hypothetical protein [Bradyrhizobium sp.]
MTTCHLDIESYSECDLGECGAYRYAEDPSTEILCIGFAFDDQDVRQWRPGEPLPSDLVAHVESGGEIRAHNAAFERTVLNGVAGRKIGFPRTAVLLCFESRTWRTSDVRNNQSVDSIESVSMIPREVTTVKSSWSGENKTPPSVVSNLDISMESLTVK